MREPLIFFLIFSALILLAALRLRTHPDPRNSILFFRVHGVKTKTEARKIAKQMSNLMFWIGGVIAAACVIGLIIAGQGQ